MDNEWQPCVIRIRLKVPSVRIVLSIGSLNGKNRLSDGHPRFFFYQIFRL